MSQLSCGCSRTLTARRWRGHLPPVTRARDVGARRLFGPVSPLPNVTGRLLSAGTDLPGFFDSAWNPDFFVPVFAAAGFASWGCAHTWEVPVGSIPAPCATTVAAEEWESLGLRRRAVSRFGLRAFSRRLLPTLNVAFAQLPYYTQISPAQLNAQMQGLSVLMDPDLIIDLIGPTTPTLHPPAASPSPFPTRRPSCADTAGIWVRAPSSTWSASGVDSAMRSSSFRAPIPPIRAEDCCPWPSANSIRRWPREATGGRG